MLASFLYSLNWNPFYCILFRALVSIEREMLIIWLDADYRDPSHPLPFSSPWNFVSVLCHFNRMPLNSPGQREHCNNGKVCKLKTCPKLSVIMSKNIKIIIMNEKTHLFTMGLTLERLGFFFFFPCLWFKVFLSY